MSDAMAHRSPPETVLAGLLYLMNAYRRTPCPCLASCIARHCDYVASHPKAAPVIRDIVAAMKAEWERVALAVPQPTMTRARRWFSFH